MIYALAGKLELWSIAMRVLFIAEGSYPYNRGRVSVWCDQLIQHLPDFRFQVLTVLGAEPQGPSLELPSHAFLSQVIQTYIPRQGLRRATPAEAQAFDYHLANFLEFARGDMRALASGLLGLAQLGNSLDLAALLERKEAWNAIRKALDALQKRPARLAEVAQASEWLRTLASVLCTPPTADLVHSVSTGLAGIQAWLASRKHGIPLIVTEPSVFVREGYLASNLSMARVVKLLRSRFYRALARLIYLQADRIITMSPSGQEWQLRLGAPKGRTQVISVHLPANRGDQELILMPNIVWLGPVGALNPLVASFTLTKQLMPAARFSLSSLMGIKTDLDEMALRLTSLQISAVGVDWQIDSAEKGFAAGDVLVLEDADGHLLVIEGNRSGKSQRAFDEAFLSARRVKLSTPPILAQALLETAQKVAERDGSQPTSTVTLAQGIRQMCAQYRLVYGQVSQVYEDRITFFDRLEALDELDPAQVLQDFEDLEEELYLALED